MLDEVTKVPETPVGGYDEDDRQALADIVHDAQRLFGDAVSRARAGGLKVDLQVGPDPEGRSGDALFVRVVREYRATEGRR